MQRQPLYRSTDPSSIWVKPNGQNLNSQLSSQNVTEKFTEKIDIGSVIVESANRFLLTTHRDDAEVNFKFVL